MGYTGNDIRGGDDIALEIERKGIILGIDRDNEAQLRAPAKVLWYESKHLPVSPLLQI